MSFLALLCRNINYNKLYSKNMVRVILESPYAGDIERNVKYARMAVRDSLSRGEAPIASHLLYTQEGISRKW